MMPGVAIQSVSVRIHPTQFPAAAAAALRDSLRAREMNHQFHYATPKQALRWLRLHEALSPARTDSDCGRIYEAAFTDAATRLAGAPAVEVVSLGCGGGQKDAQLLRRLTAALPGGALSYVPVDVSVALTLVAREAASAAGVDPVPTAPLVMDLAASDDWAGALEPVLGGTGPRVVCFFGMLPNFASGQVLPQLAALLRPGDLLLVSANLAPGPDYAAGVAQVLPLYDNAPTRDWLWTVLTDLGVERADGDMTFTVEPEPAGAGLLRIVSRVTFRRACRVEYGGEVFAFSAGERFRLFFSCRHTPERLAALLARHGVTVMAQWSNGSGEEGVFLCGRGGFKADNLVAMPPSPASLPA